MACGSCGRKRKGMPIGYGIRPKDKDVMRPGPKKEK